MPQNLFTHINGQLVLTSETDINSTNDAMRSRFGLYESMLWRNGVIELFDVHWARLTNGMVQLGFRLSPDWDTAFFEFKIKELIQLNQLKNLARIRLQVYTDDFIPPFSPKYYIEAIALDNTVIEWNEKGLIVDVLENFQKPITKESNFKISHSQHYSLARQMIAAKGLDDVLLLNTNDRIIESSIANIFWVKDHVFYTPPLSEGCLAGTMRHWLLLKMKINQIPFQEKSIDLEGLLAADELFCCNGIRFIRWVKQLRNTQYSYRLTKELYQMLHNY